MMFDIQCTIINENKDQDDVAYSGSAALFLDNVGNTFALNTSTLEQYIPNTTFVYHLEESIFSCGVLMAGAVLWLARINIISCISCCWSCILWRSVLTIEWGSGVFADVGPVFLWVFDRGPYPA